MITSPEQRRVRVWFGTHLLHDYRAEAAAAQSYAEAIGRRFGGLRITIDSEADDALTPLPCQQLWTGAQHLTPAPDH